MTTFTYSTELDLGGPSLLETEALERLHNILESTWLAYQETKSALIEQGVKSWVQEQEKKGRSVNDDWINEHRAWETRQYSSDDRTVRVDLGGSKSITTETVSQAIKELAATNELPVGIEISLKMKELRATVSIGGSSSWRNDRLQIPCFSRI
jgi:hypothetical protein